MPSRVSNFTDLPGKEVGMDKAKGRAKEAYGALTGDEALKAEGRAEEGRGGGQTAGRNQASGEE